jgi:hypothetical protein
VDVFSWDMVLLDDMINAKTSIKLLRNLGIALIALPEPITTPFGAALVLTSRYLSRRLEASLSKLIRERVRQYLTHFKGLKFNTARDVVRHTVATESLFLRYKVDDSPKVAASRHDAYGAAGKMIYHTIDWKSLFLRYKVNDSPKVAASRHDAYGAAGKMIYHTIDWKSLSRRYKTDSARTHTSSTVKGVVHHPLNMRLLSQRYEKVRADPVKVVRHTINMALLLRLYGSDVGSKPALKTH